MVMRLDQLLVTRGLARSRSRAQRLIRHGRVSLSNGRLLSRPAEKLPLDSPLIVTEDPEERYVSRAGLKLEALLHHRALRLDHRLVLDVGQSTGGFTDCALQHGAAHVIGIDVGHGQLDSRLREDPRVTCLEGINARYLTHSLALQQALARQAPTTLSLAVMDVSFISQTLILPELAKLLPKQAELLSLVKPQFEVGPNNVDSRGIVRDIHLYQAVEAKLRQCCIDYGFDLLSWQESPLKGGDGNREFLLHACRQ